MFDHQKNLTQMDREQVAVHGKSVFAASLGILFFILFCLLPAKIVQADTTLYIPAILSKPAIDAPSDQFIAYGFSGTLFVVNVDGQSPPKFLTELTDPYAQVAPRWSADNREIHFWYQSQQGHAFSKVPFDGSSPMTSISVTLSGDYYLIDWSSDGTKALLQHTETSTNTFQTDLYAINADGTGLRKLLSKPGSLYGATLSTDGTKITYSYQESSTTQIYVINADGSNAAQNEQPLANGTFPSWSPDDTQIAFEHADGDGYSDIYSVDVGSGSVHNLTEENSGANDMTPVWSPDGTQIAFMTYRNENWFLYVMNADGSDPAPLSSEPGFYQPNIQWSPDGDKIAYVKNFVVGFAASAVDPDIVVPITEQDLGVLDISSQTETRLTFREQAPYWYAWSN